MGAHITIGLPYWVIAIVPAAPLPFVFMIPAKPTGREGELEKY